MKPQDGQLRCHYCRHFGDFDGAVKHCIQVHPKEKTKVRRKCLFDKTGERKYQVLICGLISYTINDLSNIIIDNDNCTGKADADENSKRRVMSMGMTNSQVKVSILTLLI